MTIPATGSYDRIGLDLVAADAATIVRLGAYADSGGVPGALLFDAGTVTLSGAPPAFKEATITQSINGPAKIWLAVVGNALGAATVQYTQGVGLMGWRETSLAALYPAGVTGSAVGAFTALPNPFGSIVARAIQPLIVLRKA